MLALRDSDGYLVGVVSALSGGILDMDEWLDGNGDDGTLLVVDIVRFDEVDMMSSSIVRQEH